MQVATDMYVNDHKRHGDKHLHDTKVITIYTYAQRHLL